MKIRIQGNRLRLRLSQLELDHFALEGHVYDTVQFGPHESDALTYELIRSKLDDKVHAEFSGSEITVYVPAAQANIWTESEQVGIKHNMDIGTTDELQILIEKDFQCLHKRSDEDESELYPNPDAAAESTL
ncbi:MAG: hypothetical protein ACI959_002117 [Limisphaerales bacterium]|jgi:hypothetical protein